MLYNLIKTERGKEEIVMTDSLAKVKARKTALLKSQRKMKLTYSIEPSKETDKFKKKPSKGDPSGDVLQGPKRIR